MQSPNDILSVLQRIQVPRGSGNGNSNGNGNGMSRSDYWPSIASSAPAPAVVNVATPTPTPTIIRSPLSTGRVFSLSSASTNTNTTATATAAMAMALNNNANANANETHARNLLLALEHLTREWSKNEFRRQQLLRAQLLPRRDSDAKANNNNTNGEAAVTVDTVVDRTEAFGLLPTATQQQHQKQNPSTATATATEQQETVKPVQKPKKTRPGRAGSFPQKLHQMLNNLEREGRQDVASFELDGKAFSIHKPKLFVDTVMAKYFRMKSYASFQRQLNLYCFKRIKQGGKGRGAYTHPLFVQEQPLLSVNMKRTCIKGNSNQPKSILY